MLYPVNGGGSPIIDAAELTPFMFGAKADRTTDDGPAFQAMFDYLIETQKAFRINLCGAFYLINTPVLLPRIGDNDERVPVIVIDGAGANIKTTADITIFGGIPDDQDEAISWIGRNTFVIENITFVGTENLPNQTAIYLCATYCACIRNCFFLALGTGYTVVFGLNARLVQNISVNCITAGQGCISGEDIWTGANSPNSPSNGTVFDQCRDYGFTTMDYQFFVKGSDNVTLRQCVFEGTPNSGPAIEFNYNASPTVWRFNVIQPHFETPASSEPLVHYRGKGNLVIENPVILTQRPFIDIHDSASQTTVIVRDWVYAGDMFGANPFFIDNGDLSYWRFVDCGVDVRKSYLTTPSNWGGGTLPAYLFITGINDTGGLYDYSNGNLHYDRPGAQGLELEGNLSFYLDNASTCGTPTTKPLSYYVGTGGVIFTNGTIYDMVTTIAVFGTDMVVNAGSSTSRTFLKAELQDNKYTFSYPCIIRGINEPALIWSIACDAGLYTLTAYNPTLAPITVAAGTQYSFSCLKNIS